MSALLIKSDSKSDLKMLATLSKKLGGSVLTIAEEQYEDFALGMLMNKVKTNTNVSREEVMKKLRKE